MRNYLIAGLLVWAPLSVTFWVLSFLVNGFDSALLGWMPTHWFPQHWRVPGLGLLLAFVVVLITGILTTNFLGKKIVKWADYLLSKIPLVRSIYTGVKQVSDTFLTSGGDSFRKAVLLEFPRPGVWSIGLVVGEPGPRMPNHFREGYLDVFIPTVPIPTNGFFLMVKREETIELDMSVDEALKYLISMGVINPKELIKPEAI